MQIVIPLEGQVRTVIRSSFVAAKRLAESQYTLSGDNFQMTGVTAEQVLILPDTVGVIEGQAVTDDMKMQALPFEGFIAVSAEETLPAVLGLLLRSAVADGKLTDEELLSVQPALEGRVWQPGLSVQVGDVYACGGFLWRCIQAHTTQSDWLPDKVPALWHKVEIVHEDEVRVWQAGVNYTAGDEVAYPDANGTLYTCLQGHTALAGWEPPNVPALWKANGEPEVVPEEAEIVRRIYGLFLKGQTPYGIKTSLEAEGIPTPAGKKTWQTATILSILTNEKYKGDALLQKTFCTDFLTKKMKVNEGEVPQYYVENSHPAIVTDEVFNMVQEEIEHRRQAGRQHNGTSCFAGRIFCGCCGEMYGSKVWHSTDKYRRVIWQCNAKFKDGHHCGTPHLTEAEIQQRFLKAFNRLLDERTFILEDTAAIMEQLTATAELEAKAENLREEMDVVSELIRQAIEQNASMTMDQAEFEQKYQSLSERFQRAADHLKGIEAECARRAHKRSELEAFIKNLRGREMPIEEFDAMLWMSMVKRVMVEVDGSMRFTFANEMEVII